VCFKPAAKRCKVSSLKQVQLQFFNQSLWSVVKITVKIFAGSLLALIILFHILDPELVSNLPSIASLLGQHCAAIDTKRGVLFLLFNAVKTFRADCTNAG
jgi:hypothetical protein